MALGCGRVEETVYRVTASVPTLLDLPTCDAERENDVYFVEAEDAYYRCQNGSYSVTWLFDEDDAPSVPGGVGGSGFPSGGDGDSAGGGRFSTGGWNGNETGGASSGGASLRGTGGSTGRGDGGSASGGSPPDEPFDPFEDGWIRWLGVLDDRPSSPEVGDALYWQEEGALCVWDGTTWILLHSEEGTADCKAWEEDETFSIPEETRDVLWLSAALDDAGNAFLSWTGQATGLSYEDYAYAQRYAVGQGWDARIQLGGSQSIWSDVAATGDGKALVLWLNESTYPRLRTETRFDGGAWQPSLAVPDLDSQFGVLEVQFDSLDRAVTAWSRDQDVVVSTRPWLGSWSEPIVVGSGIGEALAYEPRLAVGPAGSLCAYWVNADLKTKAWDVYVSLYHPDTGWSEQERIYEAKGIVRHHTAAFDHTGNMILAFTDEMDAAQPVFVIGYDGATFSEAQMLSTPTEAALDLRTTYTRAGTALVVWDGKSGISAVSKAMGGSFSSPNSWSGSGKDPLLVPLGDADALITWIQGHQLFARRYAPSVGWITSENLGKTAIFEVHALASDSKGNAIAAFSQEEAFVTKFYH